ncbi:ketose-bisphosphate aldolase [Patescibacteria group bacterium]
MKLLEYLNKAKNEKWVMGQFNFSTLEQLKGIISAAENLSSPLILGTSESESEFLGLKQILALVSTFREETGLPVFLNLDHGKNLDYIRKAIDFGYDSVHFDGSELSLSDNIKITKELVDYAKKNNVFLEGEVGHLKGSSELHKEKAKIEKGGLTEVNDAEKFVKETGVDSLAVAIGNIHGVYAEMPEFDFERLRKIREKLELPLVLHGGSGFPKEEIKKIVKAGISKININTELRIAWRNCLEKSLKENSQEVRPYIILSSISEAIQKVVEEKIKLFGSEKKA